LLQAGHQIASPWGHGTRAASRQRHGDVDTIPAGRSRVHRRRQTGHPESTRNVETPGQRDDGLHVLAAPEGKRRTFGERDELDGLLGRPHRLERAVDAKVEDESGYSRDGKSHGEAHQEQFSLERRGLFQQAKTTAPPRAVQGMQVRLPRLRSISPAEPPSVQCRKCVPHGRADASRIAALFVVAYVQYAASSAPCASGASTLACCTDLRHGTLASHPVSAPAENVPTQPPPRRVGTGLLFASALLAFFYVLISGAGSLRRPIIVDIGPSTGRYGSGFEDSEETPPTTSRWTRHNAAFDIPLDVDASAVRFSLRAARYLDEPTRITVSVNRRSFASFKQPRGRQRIQEIDAPLPAGPLKFELSSDDPNLGMALDWIRIDGARWRVPLQEWTVWMLPLGILGALVLSGASLPLAGGTTALILAALAGFAAIDPFGFVHSMRDVAAPSVAFSILAALIFRGRTAAVLAITATVLVKGAFLFHPNYFYNDVRQNDRYVGALRSYEGSVMERSRQAQVNLGVGYPRIVAGRKYAFPYSPVFYLPFTALPPDRDIVVRAIKHVALFAAAAEVDARGARARPPGRGSGRVSPRKAERSEGHRTAVRGDPRHVCDLRLEPF